MERLSSLYACALFELALERGSVDVFLDQAAMLRDTLQDEQCLRVLVHPHISAAEKHEVFSNAFAGHLHDDLLGFLFLVTDKNRENFLLPALSELIRLIERHQNKVTAQVLSATAYDGKQIDALREALSDKLRKSVEISLKVDPTVIGGPHIFVDGYYIDWTIKERLRDLTVHMKVGCSA